MADAMDAIMDLAGRLGEAIRLHPRYERLRAADEAVRADKSATDALEAYNRAAAQMQQKEHAGRPIEVEEKRQLSRLQQVVAANETVKAFMRAQADYAELMRSMNEAIFASITGDEADADDDAPPTGPHIAAP
jgi:cell fate (sporulation/competence/biofilm development) regulator YlbF (YheA/YmcA/DUF963 family)